MKKQGKDKYYIENDSPQPQDLVALGFWNSKPLPFRPSEKFNVVFKR
jgi:hypothetical protein